MESIFKFNNLRFSPEMFFHISVIKDDCCVAYGCFFLPEHLQVSGGANRRLMPEVQHSSLLIRVEPDTRLKRVSGTDKALLPSTSIIRVIRVNICARIE